MKAILCQNHGTPDTLILADIPQFLAADNEVVIAVEACSANFPDTLIIQNLYQFKPELPFSPGGEVAGTIKSVGKEINNFKIGDRVFALCGWGGFAEEVAVEATKVFPMLPGMDFVTAASVMYNYGTSYHALKDRAKLQTGETLLVLGAAGGVGLAAVELGKMMGAKVIAAASSAEKLAICQEKGADELINYTEEDLKDKLKELTAGKGVDVVYDPVGDKFAEPAIRSMAWKGRYLVVGFAGGEIPKIPLNLALLKGCEIVGVFWGRFAATEPKNSFQNIQELAGYFMKGTLKPHIFKTYSLEESPQALEDLMNRKVIGKAVVITSEKAFDRGVTLPEKVKKKEVPAEMNGKKIFASLAELKAFEGKSLGITDWQTVSQEMINEFASATFDNQWIHVDADKAAASPFGGTIAHGLLTLSLTPKFLSDLFEITSSKMGVNYGMNKVRFITPVPSGSKLRMNAVLKSVEMKKPGVAKLLIEATLELENSSKPACVAELLSVIYASNP